MSTPIPYEKWRKEQIDRAEDAASNFGYYLMAHCRAEALKKASAHAPPSTKAELEEIVTEAVDIALHNVADLLEGFWVTHAGPKHRTEFALAVRVTDEEGQIIERIDVSPCLIDLPIGYWNWKEDFLSQ
jgi:hypothetical protein